MYTHVNFVHIKRHRLTFATCYKKKEMKSIVHKINIYFIQFQYTLIYGMLLNVICTVGCIEKGVLVRTRTDRNFETVSHADSHTLTVTQLNYIYKYFSYTCSNGITYVLLRFNGSKFSFKYMSLFVIVFNGSTTLVLVSCISHILNSDESDGY